MHLTVLAAQLAAPLLLHLVALVQRQLLPKLPADSSAPSSEAEAEPEADELVPLQLLAEFARRSTKAVAPVKPRRTSSKPIVRFSTYAPPSATLPFQCLVLHAIPHLPADPISNLCNVIG